MTIARRLIVLLAVPLLTFFGLGLFMRAQLARIEDRTRFVAESRVIALARLGGHLAQLCRTARQSPEPAPRQG